MANVGIGISVQLMGDGTSTVFNVDLERDPYTISANVVNWFSENARTSLPSGITDAAASSASEGVGGEEIALESAALSGTVLTITISDANNSGQFTTFTGTLLFGA